MGRITLSDLLYIWAVAFIVALCVIGSIKFSFVASVFALTNFILLAYYFSCPSADQNTIDDFFTGVRLVAHRGAAIEGPENTLGAFRLARELGADSVEFDVSVTDDGAVVLMHDDTLERTTDGTGPIAATSLHQVRKLNAAAKYDGDNKDRFAFENVPTLDEAVLTARELQLKMFIDVKDCDDKTIAALLQLYQTHTDLYQWAAICSFYHSVIYQIKRSDPHIVTGHTWRHNFYTYHDIEGRRPRYRQPWRHWMALLTDQLNIWLIHSWLFKLTGASFVLANERSISKRYVAEWKQHGIKVATWTVDPKIEKLYFMNALKVPVMTDRLADLISE